MATVYKTLTNNDVTSTRTLLHEAIPITGTIVSGTYGHFEAETNIKDYSHEMFQSVYDYPFLSSSANHIFDIAVGYSTSSTWDTLGKNDPYHDKKVNIYNQMAQLLVGYDHTGSIRRFDQDGDLTGGSKVTGSVFINFSRLLVKDEIKKGSFAITLGTGAYDIPFTTASYKVGDTSGSTKFKVNSPAGEYGILYDQSSTSTLDGTAVGLIYYQAGIVVLNYVNHITGSGLGNQRSAGGAALGYAAGIGTTFNRDGETALGLLTGSYSPSASADAWRNRIQNISFNNTVELNSTIYFCRANHNEFNYSANPTYVTGSKILVKENPDDAPISYITSVGLYSADNELLAVAKLSEPLKKDPTNEITLRVRLDY